jgi:integrase
MARVGWRSLDDPGGALQDQARPRTAALPRRVQRARQRLQVREERLPTTGETGIGGFSKFKAQFDARMLDELRKMAEGRGDDPAKVSLNRWTIHDLRRTARSAMTQAGISPDHAERALGHVIGGVRGVYDRHGYREEKRRAFEALAAHVERIVNPQANVVPMRRAAETTAGA